MADRADSNAILSIEQLTHSDLIGKETEKHSASKLFDEAYASIKEHASELSVGAAVAAGVAGLYMARGRIFSALAKTESNFGYACLDTAAMMGSNSAKFELGMLHLNGAQNFSKCESSALNYFEQAASRGHTGAQVQMALNSPSYEGQMQWLNKAIAGGDKEAAHILTARREYWGSEAFKEKRIRQGVQFLE
ncbi:MAG: hypothetical protein K2X27_12595 [Candidatus Obscuribacterales bacterium]|nr:hypothetical protein [Candidatus Obscuribacterales bacterium]